MIYTQNVSGLFLYFRHEGFCAIECRNDLIGHSLSHLLIHTIYSISYAFPSFLPTFLPSYLPTFLPSYLPTFLPSSLTHSLTHTLTHSHTHTLTHLPTLCIIDTVSVARGFTSFITRLMASSTSSMGYSSHRSGFVIVLIKSTQCVNEFRLIVTQQYSNTRRHN
jgi:hypothetical protein